MSRQSQFQSTAKRKTVDGSNHRFGKIGDKIKYLFVSIGGKFGAFFHRIISKFRYISSGDKSFLSAAGQDNEFRFFINPQHFKSIVNLAEGFPVQGIQFVRSIDGDYRSEEHTSELQSRENLVCRLLL